MSSLSSTQDAGITQELDFYQAMQDFTDMFPEMECEVIEAVLRANNGAVYSTIDQLLSMTGGEDCEAIEFLRGEDDVDDSGPVEAAAISPHYINTQDLDFGSDVSPSNLDEMRDMVPELPPKQRRTSQRSSKHSPQPPSPPMPELEVDSPDLMDASINEIMNLPPAPPPPNISPHHSGVQIKAKKQKRSEPWETPPQPIPGFIHGAPSAPQAKNPVASIEKVPGIRARSKSMPTAYYKHMNPVCLYSGKGKRSKWEPLLLGDLPDDFLRLDLGPKKRFKQDDQQSVGSSVGDPFESMSDTKKRHAKDRHRRHRSQEDKQLHNTSSTSSVFSSPAPHSAFSSSSPPVSHSHTGMELSPNNQSASHLTSPSSKGHEHKKSRQTSGPQVQRSATMPHPGENSISQSGDWLTARLVENERRRNTLDSNDHEMAQYLQDEYLALVLQNSEFLEELTRNKDFMQTLTTEVDPQSHVSTLSSNTQSDVTRTNTTPYTEEPQLEDTLPQSAIEGYGNDRQNELSAFPHDCDWGVVHPESTSHTSDKHVELRKQLENMGTSSRRKLADLARRFFSRKKRQPSKPLYKNLHTPSTMNLLLEEEVPEQNLVQHSPS